VKNPVIMAVAAYPPLLSFALIVTSLAYNELFLVGALNFTQNICGVALEREIKVYTPESCRQYWACIADILLQNWHGGVSRSKFVTADLNELGHTPMWLRIKDGKLYCVRIIAEKRKLRLKIYRALHYINRLNRILRGKGIIKIPDDTEWWTHHSDMVKISSEKSHLPPVFSVSGAKEYLDIPGIPFMSFSDSIYKRESSIFNDESQMSYDTFRRIWKRKKNAAYFHGSLSDCGEAVMKHGGNINFVLGQSWFLKHLLPKAPFCKVYERHQS